MILTGNDSNAKSKHQRKYFNILFNFSDTPSSPVTLSQAAVDDPAFTEKGRKINHLNKTLCSITSTINLFPLTQTKFLGRP